MSTCNADPCAPSLFPYRFPEEISYGSKGGPKFKTSVLTSMAGIEKRKVNWAQLRCEYEVKDAIRTPKQAEDLKAFFMCRRGKSRSFRFKDWADFTIQNQFWFQGDGITSVIQLWKTYISGINVYYRQIVQPVRGTFLLKASSGVDWYEAGTPGASMAGVHIYDVDDSTGLVTFSVPPANGVSFTIVYAEFDVHARFDTDKMVMNHDHWRAQSWENIPIVELYDAPRIPYGQPGMMPFNVAVYDDAAGTASTNPGPTSTDLPSISTASQTTLPLLAFDGEVPSASGQGVDPVTIIMAQISMAMPPDPVMAGYRQRYLDGSASDYVAMCWLVYCTLTGASDDGAGNNLTEALVPLFKRYDGIPFGPDGPLSSVSAYSVQFGHNPSQWNTLYYSFPSQGEFQRLRRAYNMNSLDEQSYVLYALLAQGNDPKLYGLPEITEFAANNPGMVLTPGI